MLSCALIGGAALFWSSGCASQRSSDEMLSQVIRELEADDSASQVQKPVAPMTAKAASTKPAPATAARPATAPAAVAQHPVGAPIGAVVIQPDCIVEVAVKEDPSLNGRYLVNDFAAIDFGYAGLVILSDMTGEQAAAKVKSVLEQSYLHQATVTVRVTKASYDRVTVQGEVVHPGQLKIGPGTSISLQDALLRAGGLKPQANQTLVKIVHDGMLSPFGAAADGDLYSLMTDKGDPMVPDVQIQNNDLVYVYTRDAQPLGERTIVVLGEVTRPGPVRFSTGEPCTLMYLLFKMGGLPRFAKADAIEIVRRDKDGAENKIVANADAILKFGRPQDDVPLENGDTVLVPTRTFSLF